MSGKCRMKKQEETYNEDEIRYDYASGFNAELIDYAILLMPYFDKEKNVQHFLKIIAKQERGYTNGSGFANDKEP